MKFNLNPFKKPSVARLHSEDMRGSALEISPAPHSSGIERALLQKLVLITSFLFVLASAEAKSPALQQFDSFEEMQSKSKNEFIKLQNKMQEMGTDTVRYEVGNKKMMIIDHDGMIEYDETGGGNTIKITGVDGVARSIKIEGNIDGTQKIDGDPETAKRKGNIRSLEHKFSQDKESLSQTKVGSTIDLTKMEEVKVFLSVQDKFVQGVEDALASMETSDGTVAQK